MVPGLPVIHLQLHINVKYEMEKINNTAVLSIVAIPSSINPAIASIPHPAANAAIRGRTIKATGGANFSLMSTYISTSIKANPIIANFIIIVPPNHPFL